MAAAQSPEAKELALVGKVEMRIALTDSEKKLEDLLKVYLAPLLLKLGSEHVAVRNKVRRSLFNTALFVCVVNAADRGFSRSFLSASTSTPASSHSTLRTSRIKHL